MRKSWIQIIVMAVVLLLCGVSAAAQAPSSFPYAYPAQNDSTTGTVQFSAVKINSSGNAVVLANTDTNGYAGICVANCGTTGTAWIAFAGQVPVTMDNTATAQHYVVYATTTSGRGKDSGATTFPLAQGIIGRVVTGAAAAAQAMVLLAPPEINTLGLSIAGSDFCQDAGSTDSYACNLTPAITAYSIGARYRFKANTANTGVATIAFSGLSAITIKKAAGGITTDLNDNDIRVGQWVDLVYDGTNMQMTSLLGNAGGGSSSWSGITDPTASVTHVMSSWLTEFDYTTPLAASFRWANTTAATSGTSQSSPILNLCGHGWSTATPADTVECVNLQFVIPNGANSLELATFSLNSGSTSTSKGYSFDGKVFVPSTGSYNVGLQGSRLAVVDTSGFESSCGARGAFFSTTANIDGGGVAGGIGCLASTLITVNGPSINDEAGMIFGANSRRQVTSSYTNATTTPSTVFTWSPPAIAHNYSFDCRLFYQSSATTDSLVLSFNSSVAPTNLTGHARIFTTLTGTNTDATVTTTSSGNVAVLTGAAPNAAATNYEAYFYGTLEEPSSGGTFAIQAASSAAGTITILRGSACYLY